MHLHLLIPPENLLGSQSISSPGNPPGILVRILSGFLSSILLGISPRIIFGISSGIPKGIPSGIPLGLSPRKKTSEHSSEVLGIP